MREQVASDPILTVCHQQMCRLGIRRLLIMQGESSWQLAQLAVISQQFIGDWITISSADDLHAMATLPCYRAKKAPLLLGNTFQHGIVDARKGFNAEAFAILSGCLQAGSFFVLLLPTVTGGQSDIFVDPYRYRDEDSLRWADVEEAIVTPHFCQHINQLFQQDNTLMIWRENRGLQASLLSVSCAWSPPMGQATSQQAECIKTLCQKQHKNMLITAARGRGKSAIAGLLTAALPEDHFYLVSPSKQTAQAVLTFSHENIQFYAPDQLWLTCQTQTEPTLIADWLIVDEAAMIPPTLLMAYQPYFQHILFITTIQGYEGTGRGFILKFCEHLVDWQLFTLTEPIRWSAHDPLEPLTDRILMMSAERDIAALQGYRRYKTCQNVQPALINIEGDCHLIDAVSFITHPQRLIQFYGLLTAAHYRTSPLDLRRLLDAPKQILAYYQPRDERSSLMGDRQQHGMIGAIWGVQEGGLTVPLARAVWAGTRRPRGNLVAQSLAAHAGFWHAALYSSWRISRIAVDYLYRRQGIGRQLVRWFIQQAQQHQQDFVSVAFGYTATLQQFWSSLGFKWVLIGSHRQASSGCYSAIMIYPLSVRAEQLTCQAVQKFNANHRYFQRFVDVPLASLSVEQRRDVPLSDDDLDDLIGFAFASRPFEVSYPAICRLGRDYPELIEACEQLFIEQQQDYRQIIVGRQPRIAQLRQMVASLLKDAYPKQCRLRQADLLS